MQRFWAGNINHYLVLFVFYYCRLYHPWDLSFTNLKILLQYLIKLYDVSFLLNELLQEVFLYPTFFSLVVLICAWLVSVDQKIVNCKLMSWLKSSSTINSCDRFSCINMTHFMVGVFCMEWYWQKKVS